jgi:hypothetical protein
MISLPKTNLEILSFLNALLVQFSKLNGYIFVISHKNNGESDKITIGMKFAAEESHEIVLDLLATDEKLQEQFNDARLQVVSFTRLNEKAK